MGINVDRHHDGSVTLYTTDSAGYLVHRHYVGYSLREARACFRQYLALVEG